MSHFSRVEDIVVSYFALKNYVVLRNVPFRKDNRWSDIDVIAFNSDEMIIAL